MASVEEIIAAGRAAHPEVAVPKDALARLVRQRLDGEEHPDAIVADEVYLACACALGDRAAIAAFERRYFGVIPAALSRFALGRGEIAEVEQILRIRLFVTEPGDLVPRVVMYAGQGHLGGLLRVAAIRAGINLLKERGRLGEAGDDGLADIPVAADDPALARLKQQYRSAFKAAFEAAVATLSSRERSLLDLSIVKHASIDRIGAVYAVHRATAARWVASARDKLTSAVHRILGERLAIQAAELDGLLPIVESQLELSLERLLRAEPSPGNPALDQP